MCEPYHSVVQFEDRGPGDPTSGRLDMVLGPVKNLGRKVWDWFHLSKAGAGHSEALMKALASLHLVPNNTKYEIAWWNRVVKIDGYYHGDMDNHRALIACEKYADASSIGDIQIFRRWFESTLRASDRGYIYIEMFRSMLSHEGRLTLEGKMKKIDPRFDGGGYGPYHLPQPMINAMVGLTRKRNLLAPEWSDNDKLWAPKGLAV